MGSYSRYTGGECRLALVGQSYKAPWMSPAPWASVAEQVRHTPTATKYMEELERQKPALDKLTQDERDQRVLELQRRMLPEEDIRNQRPRLPAVSTELVRRQRLFLERFTQVEKDLNEMPYDERAAKLAQVKRETMGREYSEPQAAPPRTNCLTSMTGACGSVTRTTSFLTATSTGVTCPCRPVRRITFRRATYAH